MLAALGIMALALAIPGAALAHKGHGRHNGRHHGLKRRGYHASVRFEHFGAKIASEPTGTGTGTGAGTGTGTTSNSPTTPTATENAGTVASYNATTGLLTLTLNNKSTVEGNVTSNTEIRCIKAATTSPAPPTGQPSDDSQGDDNGQGDDQSRGDMNQQGDEQSSSSDEPQQGDDGQDSSDDEESQSAPEPPCDTSALTPGALVRFAELRIGPSGSEFESIVLVR